MADRDRKDIAHPDQLQRGNAVETPEQREERKRKESRALDEALEETFPTSDPVSPFVPAVRTSPETEGARKNAAPRCAHDHCRCEVSPPAVWCSDECREAQQGDASSSSSTASGCVCNHRGCG